MDRKVKAEEAIHRLPPHRLLSQEQEIFQWISELLNPKRYKEMESHRNGETWAAIVAEEEFLAAAPVLMCARPSACCCAPTATTG